MMLHYTYNWYKNQHQKNHHLFPVLLAAQRRFAAFFPSQFLLFFLHII